MTFTVAIAPNSDYLRITVAGPTSLSSFAALVTQLAGELERFQARCVLLDLRQVQGRLSTSEQQLVGELAAKRFSPLYKLASIVPRGEITRNSERAALQLGLAVRVFDSEAGAVAWLRQSEANVPGPAAVPVAPGRGA